MACFPNEAFIVRIRDFITIDPKCADKNFSLWTFIVKALAVRPGFP